MNIKQRLLLIILLLTGMQSAFALLPNESSPTTFLGPSLRGSYTSKIYDSSAFSVLGEVGAKNFRAGATIAILVEENNYFKISGEYLFQNLTYSFLTGTTDEWVQQMALGAGYEYDLGGAFDPRINVDGYVSYSPSKTLTNGFVTFPINSVQQTLTEERRIAGSVGLGISPGMSVLLWEGGRASAAMNYDSVRYDNSYSPKRNAKGLGATGSLQQNIYDGIDLNVGASSRAPFNNYYANVNFSDIPNMEDWIFGIGGSYTSGKESLPNSWNVLVNADYRERIDTPRKRVVRRLHDKRKHYKDEGELEQEIATQDHLVPFAGVPAVYMPQVLAIVDSFTPQCSVPVQLTGLALPNADVILLGGESFETAGSFTSTQPIFFSIRTTRPLKNGSQISINPTTGTVTAIQGSVSETYTYFVTAKNLCGKGITAGPATITLEVAA